MSKLNELKQMSPTLRAAMGRRNSIRSHVRKHTTNAEHCLTQINRLEAKLVDVTNMTAQRVAKFKADHELEVDYTAKAGSLLKDAQTVVDAEIAAIEAVTPRTKGPTPEQVAATKATNDAAKLKGQQDKAKQQAEPKDDTPKTKPPTKGEKAHKPKPEDGIVHKPDAKPVVTPVVTEPEVITEVEADDNADEIARLEAALVEAKKPKVVEDKQPVVVPVVNPVKHDDDNNVKQAISKKQRRRMNRASRAQKQQA